MANELTPQHELARVKAKLKEEIQKGIDAGLHVYDAADAAGISRALVAANVRGDEDFREWWEVSRTRVLVNHFAVAVRVEDIRQATVQKLESAGLGNKLAIMAAMADETTEEGREVLLQLAHIQAKLMPKQMELRTNQRPVKDVQEAISELEKIREERAMLMAQQEAANDANWEAVD